MEALSRSISNRRNHDQNLVLVLPPWNNIYHWQQQKQKYQSKLDWSYFFDLNSLNKYTPVIEFKEFLKEKTRVDQIFYLQNYKEGWLNGNFEEKYDFRECNEETGYYVEDENEKLFFGYFWGYEDQLSAKKFNCVSYQGRTSVMENLILKYSFDESILIDRAEVMLHENYGDVEYWRCRKSMRFAKHLVDEGNRFRRENLNSNDISDKTVFDQDWTKIKV